MAFTVELETWFKVTAHPFFKSFVYMKYDPDRTKGTVRGSKTFFAWSDMTLARRLRWKVLFGLCMSQIGPRKEYMWSDKDISDNSAMTLTFDVETWFKLIAQPLPKDILYVKYKLDWTKGREDTPDKWFRTDRLKTIRRPQSET